MYIKKCLVFIVSASLFTASFSASAALVLGDVLEFVPGTQVCTIGGTPPLCDSGAMDITGSYWGMDINDSGTLETSEKFTMIMHEGVKIGVAQPASDGFPSIDEPWIFSGNTGMHQTLSPVTEVAPGLLDFSGWGILWNDIPFSLAGDMINFPGDTGLATITCSTSSCVHSDTYILDYSGHVPLEDPSGFGGVAYSLHLEGVVNAVPLPASIWLFGSGLIALFYRCRRRL